MSISDFWIELDSVLCNVDVSIKNIKIPINLSNYKSFFSYYLQFEIILEANCILWNVYDLIRITYDLERRYYNSLHH